MNPILAIILVVFITFFFPESWAGWMQEKIERILCKPKPKKAKLAGVELLKEVDENGRTRWGIKGIALVEDEPPEISV